MVAIFEQHISLIVKKCMEIGHDIMGIVLYGGYGRGEGSWIAESDGNYRPYNDYDILLIVEDKIPKKQIKCLREDLAKQIKIRWIDIAQKTPSELKKLHPSIYNYDLKYASKLILGDPNILRLIPEIDASSLPLKEGEILYFTRLWTLLGCLDEKGFTIDRNGEEARFFRNQMAKATLAVVDVMLLQKGTYHYSYKERVKRLGGLYPERKEICELAEWALEEKLCPKAPYMKGCEVQALYGKVHYYFHKEMYNFLTRYYGHKISSPITVERHLMWGCVNVIKRVGWIILKRNMNWEKRIRIRLAQSYIAAAYNNDAEYTLRKGISFIRCFDRSFPQDASWDEARVRIAELRMGE